MRALLPSMLLVLIVLVDAGTASSQGWRELMDRNRWQGLKADLEKSRKDLETDMVKLQQNFSSALNEVNGKLLFANLPNIQKNDTDENIDTLTQSEDTLELSEENSGDFLGRLVTLVRFDMMETCWTCILC